MGDAVEPRIDLRSNVEIGIGRGLADAVLQARRRVARPAEHAHHHAAIVARPDGAVRRERIGPVALVAVDRRRGENRGGARVSQQPAEEIPAGRRQPVAPIADEGVGPRLRSISDWCRCQPLDNRFGNAGRHMKLAKRPLRRAICLAAARNKIIVSAAARPACGRKVNSHWLGPSSTSSERSGMPSAMTPRRIGSSAASS